MRDKPVVKITQKDDEPTRCQVWVNNVLAFDGIDVRSTYSPPAPLVELKPFHKSLTLLVDGAPVKFLVTAIDIADDGIMFTAQDVGSLFRMRI